MKSNYLLSILSEDRKGLVSIITSMLNRKGIDMESISTSRTDIHTQVVINIQLFTQANEIKLMALKIKNIVEVYHTEVQLLQDSSYQKTGLYILDADGYNSTILKTIQKYGATIVNYGNEEIVVQKTGRDEDIQILYNELEGQYLKSFSKSAAMSLQPLYVDDDMLVMQ